MCAACGSGIPVCAVNGVCASVAQQALATAAVFGASFFAVGKEWLRAYVHSLATRTTRLFKK